MIIKIINIPGHDMIIIFPPVFISCPGPTHITLITLNSGLSQPLQMDGENYFIDVDQKYFNKSICPDRRWMRELRLRDTMTENRFSAVPPFKLNRFLTEQGLTNISFYHTHLLSF